MRCSSWQRWEWEGGGLLGICDGKSCPGTCQTGRWAPREVSHSPFFGLFGFLTSFLSSFPLLLTLLAVLLMSPDRAVALQVCK